MTGVQTCALPISVSRLRDSQLGDERVKDIHNYIVKGVLWQAFTADEPVALLIDEIDKADIEFPNDLLHELDRMRFTVMETGDEVAAAHRPVVIITSNAEKELPDAFLRRCIFHYIDFPDRDLMARIVEVHHPGLDRDLMNQALTAFFAVRGMDRIRKPPSTSELVDWIAMLQTSGIDEVELGDGMPFLGTLLKKEQDIEAFRNRSTRRY